MITSLSNSPLFQNISVDEIEHLLNKSIYFTKHYSKDAAIAVQGQPCKHVSITLSGRIKEEFTDFAGNIILVENIPTFNPIKPIYVFGEKCYYPSTIKAKEFCRILHIERESFLSILQMNTTLLYNYLHIVCSFAQSHANRTYYLSLKTLKQKLAQYFLKLTDDGVSSTKIPCTQQELAQYFGVTRPSLARTLSELRDEKVVSVERRVVTILNKDKLCSIQ